MDEKWNKEGNKAMLLEIKYKLTETKICEYFFKGINLNDFMEIL